MIRIGVIGFGYWGPNLVRNFIEAGAHLVAICDQSAERLAIAGILYPSVKFTQEAEDLFHDETIDAVAIATPLATHYELALAALRAHKHVWLEKPMAESVEECAHLVEESVRRGLILMIDYPYVFSPAVLAIRALIQTGELGQLYYYDSVRINLGQFQPDVDVLGDLASHDFSILNSLFEDSPNAIAATGAIHLEGGPHNLAYITLHYPQGFLAHIHVNWLAPSKVRRTMLTASRRMILWDDLLADEKLKIYNRGIEPVYNQSEIRNKRIGYRTGEVCSPRLEVIEPLQLAVRHFSECIMMGRIPATSGQIGLRIAQWLKAARKSLREGGRLIEIQPAYSHS